MIQRDAGAPKPFQINRVRMNLQMPTQIFEQIAPDCMVARCIIIVILNFNTRPQMRRKVGDNLVLTHDGLSPAICSNRPSSLSRICANERCSDLDKGSTSWASQANASGAIRW
jgi:hypothetical protein